jgi:hypothetical protein
MCRNVCLGLVKEHAHSDCCEVMHACVGVCVWACTRRMLAVAFAARQCMQFLVNVFLCAVGDCCNACTCLLVQGICYCGMMHVFVLLFWRLCA